MINSRDKHAQQKKTTTPKRTKEGMKRNRRRPLKRMDDGDFPLLLLLLPLLLLLLLFFLPRFAFSFSFFFFFGMFLKKQTKKHTKKIKKKNKKKKQKKKTFHIHAILRTKTANSSRTASTPVRSLTSRCSIYDWNSPYTCTPRYSSAAGLAIRIIWKPCAAMV